MHDPYQNGQENRDPDVHVPCGNQAKLSVREAASGTQSVSDITTPTHPGAHSASDVIPPETEESAKESEREEGEISDDPNEESVDASTSSREVTHEESVEESELEEGEIIDDPSDDDSAFNSDVARALWPVDSTSSSEVSGEMWPAVSYVASVRTNHSLTIYHR